VHILPRWGRCVVTATQARPVELWLNTLPVSPKSRVHVRALIRALWEYAMWRCDIPTQRNPMELVTVRNGTKRRRQPRSLTVEEFQKLITVLARLTLIRINGVLPRSDEFLGLTCCSTDTGLRYSIQETEMLVTRQRTRQRRSLLFENNCGPTWYHFPIKLCSLIYPTLHPANRQSHFFNGVTGEDQQKVRFVIFAANQPPFLGAGSFRRVVQTSRAFRQS